MLRMRTMIALGTGFAAGYIAASGRGPELVAQARATVDKVLGDTGLADAGQRIADAGRDVADAAGARVQDTVDDVAAATADRVSGVADRISSSDHPLDEDDPDHGVTVAPTPPQAKS